MMLINLCCLALCLPLICAATLPVQQSEALVDSLADEEFNVPQHGTWERVIVGAPGQNSVPIMVQCNALYGAGVEARSCFNALRFAPLGLQQQIWFANNGPPDMPGNRLPVVIVSNDTSCFLSPRLQPPHLIGHASAWNISEAARAVITHCVIPRRVGGRAAHIGGDNKLAVLVCGGGPYNHLQCGQPIRATPRSCGYILGEMRRNEQGETPLGYPYTTETIEPKLALVPILRSGLGMVDAVQALLPFPVPVHHLGLFREPTALQPVEYYNNLPYHRPTPSSPSDPPPISPYPDIAILLDPIIATGGTSVAAIQTLLEWGVKKVIVITILASEGGLQRAATEGGKDGEVEIWAGACDAEVDERGMIRPGMGDVGDRLFLTIGK
ncbi:MAG: hypothetical protein Q9210_002112 [Variospora velana]